MTESKLFVLKPGDGKTFHDLPGWFIPQRTPRKPCLKNHCAKCQIETVKARIHYSRNGHATRDSVGDYCPDCKILYIKEGVQVIP